ncbi:bacteriocin fulvocin C-related protein [Amycolatopsis sp. NEAU-NG30]|uniref:Bacteriocin fulvocin C-related protein n=1 Tax=Amycolatopsis melonis TaxID=3156488 RepID=A0ABV0LIL8_9PSEU
MELKELPTDRLILAFDGTCMTCRQISITVAAACNDKLDVLPLSNPQVEQWRQQALGSEARNAPTLIEATGAGVRAWQGLTMALPLMRRIGPWRMIRILTALGQLKRESDEWLAIQGTGQAPSRELNRGKFLRLAAGVGLAIAVLGMGKTPALAADQTRRVRNLADRTGRLPQTYDEVTALPMADRRAVIGALTPRVRSNLWVEQISRYRKTHSNLSKEQASVLDQASALASVESIFQSRAVEDPAIDKQLQELQRVAIAAFGKEEAGKILATLGAADVNSNASMSMQAQSIPLAGGGPLSCNCSRESDFCAIACLGCAGCQGRPTNGVCVTGYPGCGLLYNYACDGMCDGSCHPCLP